MPNCPDNQLLQAYYDGELDDARRQEMRRHVAGCGSCTAQLADLAAMSRLLATAPAPMLLPIESLRLHRAIDAAMDGGLVRIAWALSGIAAGILIVGSVWMMHVNVARGTMQTANLSPAPPPWQAVAASVDADAMIRDETTPAAQWYLSGNGTRSDDLP